jgi:acyl-CoA dehydrogenase
MKMKPLTEIESSILADTIKDFIKQEVIPLEQDTGVYLDSISQDKIDQLQQKAKESGLWSFGTKNELGGAGLSLSNRVIHSEMMAQHRFGLFQPALNAFGRDLPAFLLNCQNPILEKYINPAISSGKGCFTAFLGHGQGNVPSCTAKKVENQWVLNGKKDFVLNVEGATFGIVLAHQETGSGELQPVLFLLDNHDPIEKKTSKLVDVLEVHSLIFNDVILDDSRRIGEIGEGEALVEQWLLEEQILLSARLIGIGKRALDYAISYAKIRETRGKMLSEFPTIKTMVTGVHNKLEAALLLVQEAAKKWDQNQSDCKKFVWMAKQFAGDSAFQAVDTSLQIHGGAGFAGDFPIERWYKEVKVARIYGISSEDCIINAAEEIFA